MSADNWGTCPKCHGVIGNTFNTLREDYDIGIDENGEFEIDYCASCKECKFQFKFNYKQDVLQSEVK